MPLIPCVGCRVLLPDEDGPTHPYIGASPACWRLHGELAVWTYDHPTSHVRHHRSVDAYAVQHPGVPGGRASQSVALHLMSLCIQLERGATAAEAVELLRHFAHREYPWLDPPSGPGRLTIADVLAVRDQERPRLLEAWPREVWLAWSAHHPTVHRWLKHWPSART